MFEGDVVKKRRYGSFALAVVAVLVLVVGGSHYISAARSSKRVMVIPIKDTIDAALPFFVKRGIVKAESQDADIIVLDINTLGGDAKAALLIRDALVESRIPTYAYIYRAISAGALIALSTEHMWMVKGGNIGAAQPFMLTFGGQSEQSPVPEGKMISYLSEEFASTARRQGHNEEIARAFVDPDYGLKGLQTKGRPLTLSEEKALEHKFIEGVCEEFEDFLKQIGYGDADVRTTRLSNSEKIARFIANPMYSWIFLLIGILGIIIEIKTPGFGGGGLIGGLSLVLFFWGNHIAQLTNWFEIILFFLGVGLVALEVFVIPGFGLAGIGGIGLIFLSIFLAMFRLPPSGFDFGMWRLVGPVSTMTIALAAGTIAVFFIVKYLPKSSLWKRLALQTEFTSMTGYVAPPDLSGLVGKMCVTDTTLRPSGAVRLNGKRYDAKSECGYIPAETRVKIIKVESASLVVEPLEEEA